MDIDRVVCGVAVFLLVVTGAGFVAGGYHRLEAVESSYTPMYSAHAGLEVTPTMVTNETSMRLTVVNTGTVGLNFGLFYSIEKHVNGSWVNVPACHLVPAVGIGLGPGGRYNHKMEVVGLDSGSYRATKDIQAEGGSLEKPYAYFTVDRPMEGDTGETPSYGFRYHYMISPYIRKSPEGPKLIFMNFGARTLYFDSSFTLEKKANGQWFEIKVKEAEGDVAAVRWGEEYKLVIGEAPFESGKYRLTVVFGVEGTSYKETLVEVFTN
jgi:hypothetical protein